MRDGTQLLRIFEKGRDGDPAGVRFQGTIGKFARECRTDRATGVTTVKVGVAGRLLSGPSGATGGHTLPLRVVLVKNGDEVLYSQMNPVDAVIPPGQAAVTWTRIVDGITAPLAVNTLDELLAADIDPDADLVPVYDGSAARLKKVKAGAFTGEGSDAAAATLITLSGLDGQVSRSIGGRFKDRVTLADFGVTGNQTVDQSALINAAIAECAAEGLVLHGSGLTMRCDAPIYL